MKETITNILLAPFRALGWLLYKAVMGIIYAVCWVYGFVTPGPCDARDAENSPY